MRVLNTVRLAYVVHDFNRTHGHSRYVAELVERYRALHEVHVFANTFDDAPPGVVTHHVPALRTTALTTILSFVPFATRLVGSGTFDLVHAQGLVLPRADIVTVHICNGRWLTGRQRQDGTSLGWRDHLFASLVVPLERRMYARPGTTIVAISRALAGDLATMYGVGDDVAVVHHGVDPAQFNPAVRRRYRAETRATLGLRDDERVFLFVGDVRKGASQAVLALERVPGRLVVVTRSDTSALQALARAHGVGERVLAVPPTREVERYYGAADVFVLPTPYDAFGMVVTEAMACGLPVITTRAAGASELIIDGETGMVLDSPVNEDALRARMAALAGDPALCERLGSAAAAAMLEHSWDRVAARTMAVYEQVLGKRRAA